MMADERYARTFMPEPDTEVDLEPFSLIRVRYAPHRIEQTATLYFPKLSDDESPPIKVFLAR